MLTPKYVFICSLGHSGSTLLDLLLGSHSKIFSLGEICFLPKNIALREKCTCGEVVTTCAFWQNVFRRINEEKNIDILNYPYSLNLGYALAGNVVDKGHQTLSYRLLAKIWSFAQYQYLSKNKVFPPLNFFLKESKEYFNNTHLIYDLVRGLTNDSIIVDSSKSIIRAANLYMSNPDDLRILLLVRDIRGVTWSYVKNNYSFKKVASLWIRNYERIIDILSKNVKPEHVHLVRYESLCAEPDVALENVCNFLGQNYEMGMVDFHKTKHHSVNGNDMRFSKEGKIRHDIGWQNGLSKDEQSWISKKLDNSKSLLDYFNTIS